MSQASAKNRALIAVAGAVAAGLIAVLLWPTTSAEPAAAPPKPPPPTPNTPAPTRPTVRAACAFKVGDQLAFDVRERRQWRLDLAQDAVNPLPIDLAGVKVPTRQQGVALLRWRLDMRAVKVDGKATIFVAAVSRPTLAGPSGPVGFGPERMTVPMLVRLGSRCDVESMARSTALDPQTGRAQQTLVARLSFRLPQDVEQRSYTELERDAVGVHELAYEVVAGREPRLRRTPAGTTELYMFDSRPGSATLDSVGHTTIVPGDRGWFASARRKRSRRFVDGATYAVVQDELHAEPIKPGQLSAVVEDTLQGWVWGDLFALRGATLEGDKDGAVPGLAGMPVATVRRMLHARLAEAALDPTASIDLARDWLRANPALIAEWVQSLRDSEGADPSTSLLLLGLRLTNDPEHQRVLTGLVNDVSQPVAVRAGAMLSLASARLFEESAIDTWRTLAVSKASAASVDGKMARAATAVLGHLARQQRAGRPAVSERATNIVRDLMSLAARGDRIVATLAGIGNAGDDTLTPLLVPRSRDDDAQIRSAAARATGKLHPRSSLAVLDGWIGTEPQPNVQNALAEATATTIALNATDQQALRSVRGPAIKALGLALANGHPWAREALEARQEAEHRADDPNPSVQAEITALLQRHPQPEL